MPSRTRRQVLAALAAAGLAGCNTLGGSEPSTETPRSTSASSPTPETPEVFVMTDYNGERWQRKWEEEIIPGFEAQSEATVQNNLHTSPPQVPATQELVAEGDPPEVYHSTATMVARHALEGDLQPVDSLVDDLVAANGALHVEYPVYSGSEARIVPHGLYLGGILHYRRDVYDELGLSVPETWTELVENARVIDESNRFDGRGFAVSGADASVHKTRNDLISWFYTAGGRFWRWQDEPGGQVELDFRTEDVRATLGLLNRLAQYSPDPANIGGASILEAWLDGTVAQCLFPNARLAGLIYDIESDPAWDRSLSIGLNTAVAPVPLRDRTLDPPTRGWARVDGTPMFQAANTEYAEQFLRYLYEGPERQADKNSVTMRTLPPYEGILETEAYRSADIYQAEGGYFLDLERQLLEEVVPRYAGDRPRTPAARYAMQPIPPDTTGEWQDAAPDILTELVQAVLVDGKPADEAIPWARQRLQSRLEDGRDLSA